MYGCLHEALSPEAWSSGLEKIPVNCASGLLNGYRLQKTDFSVLSPVEWRDLWSAASDDSFYRRVHQPNIQSKGF